MTDQKRGRRPSSTRPLRAGTSQPVPAGVGVLGPGEEGEGTEPSLGDVSFDDWFETPVFESDPDERLEELATARRGPMRLAASALLRVNARASQVRRRAGEADPPAGTPSRAEPASTPAPANKTKTNGRAAASANGKANGAKANGAKTNGAAAASANGKANGKANGAKTNGGAAAARGGTARGRSAATDARSTGPDSASRPLRARPAAPSRSGPAGRPQPEPGTRAGSVKPGLTRKRDLDTTAAMPDPAPGARPGLRERMNEALDRWAEREALAQTRLERAILPKRWQA